MVRSSSARRDALVLRSTNKPASQSGQAGEWINLPPKGATRGGVNSAWPT